MYSEPIKYLSLSLNASVTTPKYAVLENNVCDLAGLTAT
jgi:hypothetical protein